MLASMVYRQSHTGSSNETELEDRFGWLLEIIEELRSRRPDLTTQVIEAVYDSLVDLLLGRSDVGKSRAAVAGLVRNQIIWKCSDERTRRYHEDGTFRSTPAAAIPLDGERWGSSEEGIDPYEVVSGPEADRPERILEDREELEGLLETAKAFGLNAWRVIVGGMVGLSPAEIAEVYGVEVNTVHKWKSRFVLLYRAEEPGSDDGDPGGDPSTDPQ